MTPGEVTAWAKEVTRHLEAKGPAPIRLIQAGSAMVDGVLLEAFYFHALALAVPEPFKPDHLILHVRTPTFDGPLTTSGRRFTREGNLLTLGQTRVQLDPPDFSPLRATLLFLDAERRVLIRRDSAGTLCLPGGAVLRQDGTWWKSQADTDRVTADALVRILAAWDLPIEVETLSLVARRSIPRDQRVQIEHVFATSAPIEAIPEGFEVLPAEEVAQDENDRALFVGLRILSPEQSS